MNKLPLEKRAEILGMMVEGVSLRAITRLTGVSRTTSLKLLVDAGNACSAYQDRAFRDLKSKRLQVDEIWAFCYAKQKNVPADKKGILGFGDIWTWTAIDADTKLVPSWFVGSRDADHASAFMSDLASRVSGRVQLKSDGWRAYRDAVRDAFLDEVDYATLVKIYGEHPEREARYSQPDFVGCERKTVTGNPDKKHISTSFVERQNLTMRMHMRRFTWLTNALSKKMENHSYAVSLHYMYYNFVRIHKTLRTSPAMAAGITDKLWEVADIVWMIDEYDKELTESEYTLNPLPTCPNKRDQLRQC